MTSAGSNYTPEVWEATAKRLIDERDRLQARLDTATARVEELREQRDGLRQESDGWQESTSIVAGLLRDAQAENVAMRTVVEAAEAVRDGWARGVNVDPFFAAVDAWRAAQADQAAPGVEVKVEFAGTADEFKQSMLRVLRRQMAPTDRPSATEPQDQGTDDGAGTEGSQAQEGVQRAVDVSWVKFDGEEPADPAGLDAAIDLAARLHAVVEERLAVARAATPGPWAPDAPWLSDVVNSALLGPVADCSIGTGFRAQSLEDARHIALNDPADVILACERDLAVLERHHEDSEGCVGCHFDRREERYPWPCLEITDLATRYRVEVDDG
jgi:uncharacterized protein DUF6221